MRRRAMGVAVFLAAVAAVGVVIAVSLHARLPFGLNGHTTTVTHGKGGAKKHKRRHVKPAPTASVTTLAALLSPASRVAAAPFGTGGALFFGGFDAAGAATDAVQSFDGTAAVQAAGTLPVSNASAVAVSLPTSTATSTASSTATSTANSTATSTASSTASSTTSSSATSTYLLGGAVSSIYQVSQTGESIVGDLPNATADAAVATVNGTAYIIGGYSGTTELDTIVAFTPGSAPQVVATLPSPLRLATATAIGGEIYIIGGESGGAGTSRVLRFDPATTTISRFTRMPVARDREASGTSDGLIVVFGGLRTTTGARTRAIYTINPASGAVRLAGLLPRAMSDMAAASTPTQIIAAGGVNGNGVTSDAIYGIRVASR